MSAQAGDDEFRITTKLARSHGRCRANLFVKALPMFETINELSYLSKSVGEVVAELELAPHPEGGFYRETMRLPGTSGGRSQASTILFLLPAGVRLLWHRVDATEIWLWHAGSALSLMVGSTEVVLGGNFKAGQKLQALVPSHVWQSADARLGWALVSCIVTPGFEYSGFEMAPADWSPFFP